MKTPVQNEHTVLKMLEHHVDYLDSISVDGKVSVFEAKRLCLNVARDLVWNLEYNVRPTVTDIVTTPKHPDNEPLALTPVERLKRVLWNLHNASEDVSLMKSKL